MAFEKGKPKPVNGGRKKGTVNKVTADIKEVITKIVEQRIGELNADLDTMSPTSKWMILEKIMKFAYPTLSAQKIDADIKHDGKINITVNYTTPDKDGKAGS
ncbi:hypothetical protein [Pedobacter gandavensis]|uniref:hypothetical protein n=1 Tax=Pedobacter gandavensis TaxID=2679963 RepID=UPI00292ED4BD|nr:hypothetical protein [Pedobacter gandavensis]